LLLFCGARPQGFGKSAAEIRVSGGGRKQRALQKLFQPNEMAHGPPADGFNNAIAALCIAGARQAARIHHRQAAVRFTQLLVRMPE
jgi:hypothetical protein